jgi:hypothetical protein
MNVEVGGRFGCWQLSGTDHLQALSRGSVEPPCPTFAKAIKRLSANTRPLPAGDKGVKSPLSFSARGTGGHFLRGRSARESFNEGRVIEVYFPARRRCVGLLFCECAVRALGHRLSPVLRGLRSNAGSRRHGATCGEKPFKGQGLEIEIQSSMSGFTNARHSRSLWQK